MLTLTSIFLPCIYLHLISFISLFLYSTVVLIYVFDSYTLSILFACSTGGFCYFIGSITGFFAIVLVFYGVIIGDCYTFISLNVV